MAINIYGEDSSACSSPRISFSKDLPEGNGAENNNQEEVEVIRLDKSVLFDSNSDFNFCVSAFPDEKETYCPADELFFNGVIIPIQMKEKLNSINGHAKDQAEAEAEEITATTRATLIREEKGQSKSFWRFKRSSSLNCENYGQKKTSFWSLPLLLRSRSTGSTPCEHSKQNHSTAAAAVLSTTNNPKLSSMNSGSRLSCSSSTHQKPPLRKSGSNNNNNGGFGSYAVSGVRNSSVLNVPSPYIVKGTSDLLGLNTLFRSGSKDRKSSKR